MKLLRLPSAKVFALAPALDAKSLLLKMLPFQCQDYSSNDKYIACYYYKTVSIYRREDLEKYCKPESNEEISAILVEDFTKKIQAIDLFTGKDSQTYCVVSDKFGDFNRINIDQASKQKQTNAVYLNSNLGIPKYIKYCNDKDREYLILGDQQKRIKVYNSANPHQLVSVWHILDMHSVQIEFFDQKVLILLKFFDQVTLQEEIEMHWFSRQSIEEEEYPGKKVQIKSQFDKNSCLYYTMGKVENKAILVLLSENYLTYQVIESQADGFVSKGQIKKVEIEKGSWEYLDILDISSGQTPQILISYGKQVDIPEKIQQTSLSIDGPQFNKSLNSYEKIVKIVL